MNWIMLVLCLLLAAVIIGAFAMALPKSNNTPPRPHQDDEER
jgi:cytochrome oxidase Cu insertion factor (SCO1/SenC/PrrC family)